MSRLLPQRIVCLSAEAADWFWRIGAWEAVVGVTAYFEAPVDLPPKPRVSGFSSANLTPILQLQPDLVVTFSDVQAGMAAQLISRGCAVLATNQRTLAETEATLALLARLVGCAVAGEKLLAEFRDRLAPVAISERKPRPRVYFEEWNQPLITGIAWVSELIERAGGADVFAGLRDSRAAADRIVTTEQVRAADPEIMLASWCGKPVNSAEILARAGWHEIAAVRAGRVVEIPGTVILQPGFRLIHGYEQIKACLQHDADGSQ